MSEMVERVARAIWRHLDRLPVGPHGGGIIIALVLVVAALLFGAVVLFS